MLPMKLFGPPELGLNYNILNKLSENVRCLNSNIS